MKNVDTLIHAGWIVPVEPAGLVLEDHSIAVLDGTIAALLPTADARAQYQAAAVVELSGHVLIPGLVNTHTHAAMTLMRGLGGDAPLMQWLQEHIWPTEGRHVGREFVRDGTQLAMAEMLRGGTTCFQDMYFFPDEVARAATQARMRAVAGLILFDFPSAWGSGPDDYLHKGMQLHDETRGNPLVRTAFAPHAPYTVSNAPLEKVAMYAEELDIPVHMHVHETAHEVETAAAESGRRPLARLKELGLLTPRLMAVHMTQLSDSEIEDHAAAGAHVLHCPESNLKLASGFCPVHKLLTTGVNVALGTDGAASNNDLDMLGEMRTAALLAKAVSGDAGAVAADTALRMATLNGARALGLDDITGSLVPGKAADITAVNMRGLETEPIYSVITQLVYSTGRDRVTDVWVAGQQLLKDRQLTTLDEEAILARARQWRAKIQRTDVPPEEKQ
ncbi:MAG: TRZ/ATZ family hydrolase [Thiohalomonadaceae bacterium]